MKKKMEDCKIICICPKCGAELPPLGYNGEERQMYHCEKCNIHYERIGDTLWEY